MHHGIATQMISVNFSLLYGLIGFIFLTAGINNSVRDPDQKEPR